MEGRIMKSNVSVGKLLENIKQLVSLGYEIPPSALVNFQKAVYQLILDSDYEKIRKTLNLLEDVVDTAWQKSSSCSAENAYIYSLGQISSLLGIMRYSVISLDSAPAVSEDIREYLPSTKLLEGIQQYNGISHNQLAEYCGITKSALSQKISRMEHKRFFVSKKIGRNKYYFITGTGEAIIERLHLLQENTTKLQSVPVNYKVEKYIDLKQYILKSFFLGLYEGYFRSNMLQQASSEIYFNMTNDQDQEELGIIFSNRPINTNFEIRNLMRPNILRSFKNFADQELADSLLNKVKSLNDFMQNISDTIDTSLTKQNKEGSYFDKYIEVNDYVNV